MDAAAADFRPRLHYAGACQLNTRLVQGTLSKLANQKHKWQILAVLFLTFGLSYVDRQAAFSIFPVLKQQLGFSDTQLGLIGSLFIWSSALFMPIAGRLSDVMRRDVLVVGSLVLWSAATLGSGWSGSPTAFLIWRVIVGISEALYFPAAVAILAVQHPGPTRSRALGIHQAAQMAGIVIGAWYGGFAAEHVGWRMGFSLLCVVGVVYAPTLWYVLRDPARSGTVIPRGALPGLKGLVTEPFYLLLIFSFSWFCAMLWVVFAWLPNLLYEHFGLSLVGSGLNATLYSQISCVLGILLGSTLADRVVAHIRRGRLVIIAAGIILSAPCAYEMFAASTLTQYRLYAMSFGILEGFAVANIFAAACDIVPAQNYGLAAGVLNMMGSLSGGLSMLLVGLYKTKIGTVAMMRWIAVPTGFSGLVLLLGVAMMQPGVVRRGAAD